MSRNGRKMGTKSQWKRRDAKYRAEQKARRKANALRRQQVAEAAARGIPVEQLRAEQADV